MQGGPPGGSGEVHRLFLALWPEAPVREAVRATVARLQDDHAPGGRALDPARYHLTLQFFGDFDVLPERLVEDVRQAASQAKVPRFVLPLERTGRFGRVGWLGPARVPAALQRLWDALGAALATAGVRTRDHARFVPHLTVLRDMTRPWPERPVPPIDWPVDRFVLIDSRHGRTARYDVLDSWPLA